MVRSNKEKESNVFRFMCIRNGNTNYHKDFNSKESAMQYIESLNDDKIEWYGVYESKPSVDYLTCVVYKRMQPFDNSYYFKQDDSSSIKKRKATSSTHKSSKHTD